MPVGTTRMSVSTGGARGACGVRRAGVCGVRGAGGGRGVRGAGMWLCVGALVLLCAALVSAEADKRAEISPQPFLMGSRYGRSPPRMISPRNDRFFMGTRYGKRSEGPVASVEAVVGSGGEYAPLLCDYTGVFALYRCRPARAPLYDRRLEEETPPPEEN